MKAGVNLVRQLSSDGPVPPGAQLTMPSGALFHALQLRASPRGLCPRMVACDLTTTTTTTVVVVWRLAGHAGGTSRLKVKAKKAKATKAAMKKAKAKKEALKATSTVRPNSLRRLHQYIAPPVW